MNALTIHFHVEFGRDYADQNDRVVAGNECGLAFKLAEHSRRSRRLHLQRLYGHRWWNPGASQATQDIAGDWNGTLDVQGQKLRLVVHFKKNADGKLTGTIDSLDQGANDIPVSAVVQTGDDVKLEIAAISGGYQGKFNAAGAEITGEWKQGGASLPLVLKRVDDKTDQKTPKGLPATLAGFEDQASFFLVVNEERVGAMQSTWKKDGSFEGHATISLAGQKAEVTNRIAPDADGRWATISIESAVGNGQDNAPGQVRHPDVQRQIHHLGNPRRCAHL